MIVDLLYSRMSPSSSPWPPPGGLTSVVVPRPAILAVFSSVKIAAPASIILLVLRSVSNYGAWNEFVPKVHIHSQPPNASKTESELLHVGTSFTLDVIMDSDNPKNITPTQVRVTDISTPDHPSEYVPKDVIDQDGTYETDQSRVYRISWTNEGRFAAMGLKTERVSEIIDLGDGTSEYRTWECQGGMLARVVKWKFEKTLNEKFALWCAGLKQESEKRAHGDGAVVPQ